MIWTHPTRLDDSLTSDLVRVQRLVEAGRTTDGSAVDASARVDPSNPWYIGPIETWEVWTGDPARWVYDLWLYWAHGGSESECYGVVFVRHTSDPVAYIAQARFYLCAPAPAPSLFAAAAVAAASRHPDTQLGQVGLQFETVESSEEP